MTTFLEFKNLIYTNLARDANDAAAVLVVPKAINHALSAAAVMFKPPELYTSADVVLLSGTTSIEFGTAYIDILEVQNSTTDIILRYLQYESFHLIKPTLTTIKYYSIFGNDIYTNISIVGDTTLKVMYLAYPAELSADDSSPEFSQHDSFIVSMASAICWATFEETDAVNMWASVSTALGESLIQAAQAREIVAGKPIYTEAAMTGSLKSLGG